MKSKEVFDYVKEKIKEKWSCCKEDKDCHFNTFRDSLIKDINEWEKEFIP